MHRRNLFDKHSCLQAVPANESVLEFLGESAVMAYQGIQQLENSPVEITSSLGKATCVGHVSLAVSLWWTVLVAPI